MLHGIPIAATDTSPQGHGNLGNESLASFVVTIDWSEDAIYLDPVGADPMVADAADPHPADSLSATVTWDDGCVLGSYVGSSVDTDGLVLGTPTDAIDGEERM